MVNLVFETHIAACSSVLHVFAGLAIESHRSEPGLREMSKGGGHQVMRLLTLGCPRFKIPPLGLVLFPFFN